MYLFASPVQTYSDIEEHFSDTVLQYPKHDEYKDQQILHPQIAGPSNPKDLDVGKYQKDYSVEANPDIYLAIQRR